MNALIALLACLTPYVSSTTLGQLSHLSFAVLCIPGRVTRLGLARWTEGGGSCRRLQRGYQTSVDWASVLGGVLRTPLLTPTGVYLLAGDGVVVSQAGQHTQGLARFYSSLAGRPMPGLSFLAVWLIDGEARRSYPLPVEQPLPSSQAPPAAPASAPKRPRGRPKGRKNHLKSAPIRTDELTLLGRLLRASTARIAPLRVRLSVLEGAFGT